MLLLITGFNKDIDELITIFYIAILKIFQFLISPRDSSRSGYPYRHFVPTDKNNVDSSIILQSNIESNGCDTNKSIENASIRLYGLSLEL